MSSAAQGRDGADWRRSAAHWAVRVRCAVFVPGGPWEAAYQRFVRPIGRHLLPRLPHSGPGKVTAYASPPVVPVSSILLIKLDHIGDFLLAAPAFELLRQGFKAARITLLCGPWNVRIAEQSGFFDEVKAYGFFAPRAEDGRTAADPAVVDALGTFDLAIDLRVDEDTRPVLARVPARFRAGYRAAGIGEMAITLPQPDIEWSERADASRHQRQWLLNLATAVLGRFGPDETSVLVRRLAQPPPEAAGWARPIVAMNTGSGRAVKNWPLERFIALAKRIRAERGGTVVLLGGAEQAGDAERLHAALGRTGVVDLVGAVPIETSLGVLAEADMFVGNDSALGHASAALGKPTIVVFSGVDALSSWGPLGPRAIAIKADVACSPCHLSHLAQCPNGHVCMEGISTERVWEEIAGVMA